jgi:hypothetical protein
VKGLGSLLHNLEDTTDELVMRAFLNLLEASPRSANFFGNGGAFRCSN